LKIAIGSVVPHLFTGFGGGGKIIMPGIASMETTEAFHRLGSKKRRLDKSIRVGISECNPLHLIIDGAVDLLGLDFKVDTIFNM